MPEESNISFLFGCETDLDKNLNLGITEERFEHFDFVIIPTTHLHMNSPKPTNFDPKYRARLWVERLDALLNMKLPFYKIGIAHLATFLINRTTRENYLEALDSILNNELKRLFFKVAILGTGIELNQGDMNFSDNEANSGLRMFKIAKECGCKFYHGSDAHHPDCFGDTKVIFERAINLLGLKEIDILYSKKF